MDDDLDVLESTQYMLMNAGYNVIPAKNGLEGVEKYKEVKPDLVFLDIKMPIMDGYDAFFKIKEFDPTAKIAFMTAFAVEDERYQKVKEKTLLELVKKPFSLKDLEQVIEKYA